MAWFHNNKRYWRIAFLLLLILAISGPWWFDRMWVPEPYTCDAPNVVRLDETFCGVPMSITWFYTTFFGEITHIVRGLATNTISLDDAAWSMLFIAWITLPLIPFLTTSFVLLQGDHRRGYLFHRVGLGSAAILTGLIGIFGFSRASWVLWGLWLYLALVLGMLLLEKLAFRQERSLVHE
jgi:hypothetical protein